MLLGKAVQEIEMVERIKESEAREKTMTDEERERAEMMSSEIGDTSGTGAIPKDKSDKWQVEVANLVRALKDAIDAIEKAGEDEKRKLKIWLESYWHRTKQVIDQNSRNDAHRKMMYSARHASAVQYSEAIGKVEQILTLIEDKSRTPSVYQGYDRFLGSNYEWLFTINLEDDRVPPGIVPSTGPVI